MTDKEATKKVLKDMETLPLLVASDVKEVVANKYHLLPRGAQQWILNHATRRLQGMLLVAASAFTFSLLSTLIKYASYFIPSMETVFWRAFVAWLFNLVAVWASGRSLSVQKADRLALASRCITGCAGMIFGFYAMHKMVLADASVLIFTSPVITFFLGALILNEKIDSINFSIALFSFLGVICVVRPTAIFGDDHTTVETDGSPFVIACALMGATMQACAYVSMRRLQQVHYLVVINYFLLTSTIISGVSLVFIQHNFVIEMSMDVWLAVLATGFLGFVGQLFLTRGFQLESAGPASVMRYLDVVFVFIWDMTLLHEKINLWSVVGALIICSCAIVIAIRKARGH